MTPPSFANSCIRPPCWVRSGAQASSTLASNLPAFQSRESGNHDSYPLDFCIDFQPLEETTMKKRLALKLIADCAIATVDTTGIEQEVITNSIIIMLYGGVTSDR